MPGQGPPPPRAQLLLLLLLLLLLAGPAPGSPGPPEASAPADAARFGELQEPDLLARLRANRSRELGAGPGILRDERRVSLPRAAATPAIPETSRVHRALLRLSLTAPRTRGGTRPPPLPRWRPRPLRELHLRAHAARGRRSARAEDDCPLGPGRCCRLHRVRASLDELGWSDWVLSPRELRVGVCVGACPHLHRAANTHAQIKGRLHRLWPDAVPAPCCVPASYEPLVLLHRTDSGVSLRTYEDILARACHCV